MKIGFVTCVEVGLECLEEIAQLDGHLDLVLTLKDHLAVQKSGRVFVDEICAENAWELKKIDHVRDEATLKIVEDADLDWLFIVGWSQIAPPELLAIPRAGCIGMHPTMLPEGRGNAAIPWAIIKGLEKTGVTMFQLDEGVDTGPIIATQPIVIDPQETALSLYRKSSATHRDLIRTEWPRLQDGSVVANPQDEAHATTWPKRRPIDGLLSPDMDVEEVSVLVRAVGTPYPGAFWMDGDRKLVVWKGTTDDPDSADSVELRFADGNYWVTEYEWLDVPD